MTTTPQEAIPPLPEPREMDGARWGYDADDMQSYAADAVSAALSQQAAQEPQPVAWANGCDRTVPAALRYLANHDRPRGGEARFNAAHLFQLADEIECMAKRKLYAAAPAKPADHFSNAGNMVAKPAEQEKE